MGGLPNEVSPIRSLRTPNKGVADRRTQVEHISCGVVERLDHSCGDDLVIK